MECLLTFYRIMINFKINFVAHTILNSKYKTLVDCLLIFIIYLIFRGGHYAYWWSFGNYFSFWCYFC